MNYILKYSIRKFEIIDISQWYCLTVFLCIHINAALMNIRDFQIVKKQILSSPNIRMFVQVIYFNTGKW